MSTPIMMDPKQELNEAIDAAFAKDLTSQGEQASGQPVSRGRSRGLLIGIASAASVTASLLITRIVQRRLASPKTRFLFGKPRRHVRYGRVRFGRLGRVYFAYTYKLPRLPYRALMSALKSRVKAPGFLSRFSGQHV
ncbi:MAG TPA: hypothetical protein VF807_13325 [Ktedonobacterales bacterium]